MQDLLPLLFIGVVIVGFYLLVIRPTQKRQAEAQALITRLAVGQQ
ncbi:MAG: Preprotein translocase subunit, partial [Actinomycetota bacterium]|nr:Preprotein translocase subunit [Actinomycetota bacterium]